MALHLKSIPTGETSWRIPSHARQTSLNVTCCLADTYKSHILPGIPEAPLLNRKMKVFQRRFKPMNVIRYQNPGRSDLAHAFDRFASLRDEMDRLFDHSLGPVFRTPGSFSRWAPALDVYQDKDQFTVVAELPGLKKENIELSLQDGVLTISGERKQEKEGEEGYRNERFFGRFQRSVTLPASVDSSKVKATYEDGILKVVLPKAEEAKPKKIEVSVG
jgi:HSP20 family protein